MESHDDSPIGGESLTVAQHSDTILTLAGELGEVRNHLREVGRCLDAVDRRMRAETDRLDAHEQRIAVLERHHHGKAGGADQTPP